MHKLTKWVLLSLLACAPRQPVAPESVGLSSKGLGEIGSLLDALVKEKKIAGGVALVARQGQVAFLDAAGWQDVESQKPMAADTIFRICSMSKPVTSVAIMMLVDEGKVALADPLSKFIPEFKKMKVATSAGQVDAEREITIQHLLTHTSGLTYGIMGRQPFSELYTKAGVCDGLVECGGTIGDNCRRLATAPLAFHPGTAWGYSLATDVLGRVVEVASGTTLDEFFRRRIFEPLKMKDTHFQLPREKISRLAMVYRPAADKTIDRQPDGVNTRGAAVYSASYPTCGKAYYSGGAGLVSTVSDYGRFCLMLANGGELDGARILKKDTVAEMTRDHTGTFQVFQNHGDRFGLGFGVVTPQAQDKGLGSVGTFSWGGFYHTYFFVDPKLQIVGVVMTQLYPWDHMTLWKDFRQAVYRALLD